MDKLFLEATVQTPYIDFDSKTGLMQIKGRAIPDNPDNFWLPILNWFESYLLAPSEKTVFQIDLDYFNISSSKRILVLLYKLNDLSENGHNVSVEWCYNRSDEDMFEVGQDLAYMVRVPFEFVETEEVLALA
jgi:hypothetical protein